MSTDTHSQIDTAMTRLLFTPEEVRDALSSRRIISGLVGVMRQNGLDELETDQQEALHQIAVKISRILNGDADYVDNWDDIGGYSGLVAKRLRGEE